ncbi:MFS glucose transporter mfs1 [Pseudocercospora fuligena]|uniref:MFS glucose transporter mfs1 n=1 Tax=Pseudocercospora fuligena TaxID=685502 RepID=A0A8H6RPE0_9PEZI|nr:MFS glucose transporter mfs1 [Pseudocercospora fuligena]
MANAVRTSIVASNEPISYGPSGPKGLVKEPYIFALAAFASIGGFLFGYDQGVISGVLVMNNFAKEFPVLADDATLQGWMVSVLTLGAMFGAFVNGPVCDRFSRKWSLLYANIVFLIGSILQCAAQNIPMIFFGRFFCGLAIGMLSMAVPLYLSELAPPNIRGSLVALQQLGITIGILIAFWLEYGTQSIGGNGDSQKAVAWRLPLGLQMLPSVILAGGTFFLPYTPRWLVNQGRIDEAFATLKRLRRVSEDDPRLVAEMMEIKVLHLFEEESLKLKYGSQATRFQIAVQQYKELFTVPHLYKRTIIACLLQIIQQFTGINAIIYYAPTIFKKIGLTGTSISLLATGVVGIINVLSTIPAILFMDGWGRRKILMIGAIGMSIAQLIVGTLFAVYKNSWSEHRAAGWAACVFVWIYIANFAFSIGCVNWIMPSEIFPPVIRGKAVGLAISTNWLTNFIVALITPRMLNSISFGTFYFFLVFCILLFVWVYFAVPETRGIPIEEMDTIFGGNEGEEDMRRMEEIRRRLSSGNTDDQAVESVLVVGGEKGKM